MHATAIGGQDELGGVELALLVDALGLGEGQETFRTVVGAHAGIAHTAERNIVHAHMGNGVVQADAAGVGVLQHPVAVALVPVEVVQSQRTGALVHVVDGVIQVLVGHHDHQRAEDFVLGDLHVVSHVQHQGMGDLLAAGEVFIGRVDLDDLRAFLAGVLQVTLQTAVLTRVDDGSEVRVVDHGGIGLGHLGFPGVHKFLHPVFRAEDVVRGHTGLAGVQALAEGDPLGGVLHGEVLADDAGALAAQLQGHRSQVGGGGAHDVAAHGGGAGEQQVVKRQAGKRLGHIHFAIDHGHLFFREGVGDQFFQQCTGARRGFAHLDHHPVAGGQGSNQRHHRQLDRVVPGHHDAHHAQRLVFHPGLARPAQCADTTLLRFHPLAQLLGGVLEPFQGDQHFRQLGFIGGAGGEIVVEGLDPGIQIIQQQRLDAVDQLDALLRAGVRVLAVGRFLGSKDLLHAFDVSVVAVEIFHFGDHGHLPPEAFHYV